MYDDNREPLLDHIMSLIAVVAGSNVANEAKEIIEVSRALERYNVSKLAIKMAQKRANGAPLGLVTGRQNFLGIPLLSKDDVLVARQETELLGREVIAILRSQSEANPEQQLRLIDMGCGSGNITCAAAIALPTLKVWASDLTESCTELTRANLSMHFLQDRVEVMQGDLFEPLRDKGVELSIDVVAMNPPYIASSSLEKHRAELLRHEPREAFDGGPYGISIQTRLIREAPAFLKKGGYLLFEFGEGQAKQVKALVDRSKLYSDIRFAMDDCEKPRVAVLRK